VTQSLLLLGARCFSCVVFTTPSTRISACRPTASRSRLWTWVRSCRRVLDRV